MNCYEQTVAALNTELRHRQRGRAHLSGIPARRNEKRIASIVIELTELERAEAQKEETMTAEQTGARLAEIGFAEYYTEEKVAKLAAAFKRVENPEHWKLAIDARVWLEHSEVAETVEAIIFYTGAMPLVEMEALPIYGNTKFFVRFRAVGYYAAIGA